MFLKILEAILTRADGLDILADIVHRIVLGTPAWVYALFVALVGFGLSQTRTRSVGETAVLLLPLAMVAYSFVSVVLAFGWTLAAAAVWTAGVALALGAGTALGRARGARYVAGERRYEVAGSWVPLALILMVFFTRYCIAVAMGIDPALRQAGAFIAGASFAYGLLGGLFPARAVRVWMQRFAD